MQQRPFLSVKIGLKDEPNVASQGTVFIEITIIKVLSHSLPFSHFLHISSTVQSDHGLPKETHNSLSVDLYPLAVTVSV